MRRVIRISFPTALGLCLVATPAMAGSPTRVVDTTAYEFGSAAGGDFLAWARGPTLPGDYDLYVRHTGVGTTVYDAGRYQDVGNIELGGPHGDVLVYSVYTSRNVSNVRFLDLATGLVSNPPGGVNTQADEDNPAISGDYLVFGRGPANRFSSKRIVLYQFSTMNQSVIATAPTGGTVTANSIRGDFVTYTSCPSNGRCNVFRHRISTGGKVKMPNPNRANYWSSVLDDGTVYFVQGSPTNCGLNTKIKRFDAGAVTQLYDFPNGIEIADLDAVEDLGSTTVFFTRINCPNNYRSGIWKLPG